jgi:arsenite oxidase small subunit
VEFTYPDDNVTNVLVRLGEPAGGGIGPGRDIVAFNTVCPHMGGPVGADTYKPRHKVLGPCPLHLTTFDLTRFGMVVSGHATQSLPQVQLEIRQGRIFAVGMMGLVYGHASNPRG